MKGTAIILASLEEQRAAGDVNLIDPAGVNLGPADQKWPLWRNQNYTVPGDVAGWVTNLRVEDGRLVGDFEINDLGFGVAGTVEKSGLVRPDGTRDVTELKLFSIGLMNKPKGLTT